MSFYKYRLFTCILRLFLLITLLSLVFPQPAAASPVGVLVVNFTILSVKANESITIRTVDFPVRTNFTVIMGKATNKAVNGTISTEISTGVGGKQEFILPIPKELSGLAIIGVRIESKDDYKAYNWFFNRNQSNEVQPDGGLKPGLAFSKVQKNNSVTVEATNLPANTPFRVRVGPYSTFYRDYLTVQTVTTDNKGMATFPIALDKNVKDTDFISVRLDGGTTYVFGTFHNQDNGTAATAGELVKVVPCTLLYINPIPPLGPREDFDVVWTMQNTGLVDWDMNRYLFKYRGGEAMHKRDEKIFLKYTVQRGWRFDLAVDMLAPETPGWHTTTWALVNRFDETICNFKVNVYVNP